MKISVIIPTRKREKQLEKTLFGFNKQTVRDFEVIVIIDGKDDKTLQMLNEFKNYKAKYPFTYFAYQDKGGAARARNKGVEMARGKYVLIIGDDCYPDKKLIEEHLKFLTPSNACLGFIDWSNPNEFMKWISPAGAQFRYNLIKDPNNVGWQSFWTANISYPSKWHKYEQFDEKNFKDAAMEDIDLGYRFWRRRLKTILNMNAMVYHHHPYTLEQFAKRMEKVGYYTIVMINKYKKKGDREAVFRMTRRYAPFIFLPFGTRLFKYSALILSKFVEPIAKKPYWLFTLCYHFALGIEKYENKL